jgi:hypothetical protein
LKTHTPNKPNKGAFHESGIPADILGTLHFAVLQDRGIGHLATLAQLKTLVRHVIRRRGNGLVWGAQVGDFVDGFICCQNYRSQKAWLQTLP